MSTLPPLYRNQRRYYSNCAEVFNSKKAEEYASGKYTTREMEDSGGNFKGLLQLAAEAREAKTNNRNLTPFQTIKEKIKILVGYLSFKYTKEQDLEETTKDEAAAG